MKYKKLISFLAFFLAVLSVYGQNPFVLKSGEPVTIACGNSEEEVVSAQSDAHCRRSCSPR